jgi:hypothetical protein
MKKPWLENYITGSPKIWRRSALASCLGVAVLRTLTAEGVPIDVLQTGTGMALQTAEVTVPLFGSANPAPLTFEFGFETQETVAPGQIFSSFSVQLGNQNGIYALIGTVDPGGMVLAPSNPGGVTISPSAITSTAITFPNGLPGYATQYAFDLTFTIPSTFWGESTDLYFQFYDDMSGQNALGFYSVPSAASVPDSGPWSLYGLAAAALVAGRRYFAKREQ